VENNSKNEGIDIVPVEASELKKALAEYSSQESKVLAELYKWSEELLAKYFPGSVPVVIAISNMNNKVLAHYTARNGYHIPNAIEFNSTFIALNFNDREQVELDRNLVQHVLLHELIHHWQTLENEVHTNQQSAHGRSFRKKAKEIGVEGRGRLMACPYPVKMPKSARKPKKDRGESGTEPEDDSDDSPEGPVARGRAVTPQMVEAIKEAGKALKNKRIGYDVYCRKVEAILATGSASDLPKASGEDLEDESED
jgi:hypothetical protein